MKRRSGLSLVELLAAVTIVTILASAAYLGYQNYIPQAQEERVHHDLETLANALGTYDRDHPNAPYSRTDLQELKGRYIDEIPADPWGNDFIVDTVMKRLVSPGPDRILQTAVPGYPGSPTKTNIAGDDYRRPYAEQGQISFLAGTTLYKCNVDGGDREGLMSQLPAGASANQAPDRNRFLVSANNKVTLYTRNATGAFDSRDLTFGGSIVGGHDATWSPDGLKFAFIAVLPSTEGVGVGDITTGVDATLVTSSVAGVAHPSLMKGNREVLFSDSALNIYRASAADMSSITTLNIKPDGKPANDGANPAISPDGKLVTYVTAATGGDVCVRPISEAMQPLVVAKGSYKQSVFGPTGQLVAITDGNAIWITSARSSTQTSGLPLFVIDGLGTITSLSWQ